MWKIWLDGWWIVVMMALLLSLLICCNVLTRSKAREESRPVVGSCQHQNAATLGMCSSARYGQADAFLAEQNLELVWWIWLHQLVW